MVGWIFLILLVTAFQQWRMKVDWQHVPGYEFEWVSESVAGGHGYSFPGNHRWLFPETNDAGFYPTAWTEPVYTLFMALCFRILGDYSRPAILLFQSLSLLLTSIMSLYLGRQIFNLWTGLLASLFLLLIPAVPLLNQTTMGNSAFSGLLISVLAGLILYNLREISLRRSLLLGVFLGLAMLAHSAIAMLIPIAMLLIFTGRHPARIEKWKAALAIPVAALVIISPWIMRNLVTFDAFVPLRNGFGFNAYIGNPALVETYHPGERACPSGSGPAFQASTPWEAVKLTLNTENQRALYQRAYDCIERDAPPGYSQLNEAQRDRLYLDKVVSFIRTEPVEWVHITLYKFLLFFASRSTQVITSLLALVGALISVKKSQARILSLLILGFAVPYILAIPFYYRYRYPVEPLIVILASYTLYSSFHFGMKLVGKILQAIRAGSESSAG